jgi:hypothetical protein
MSSSVVMPASVATALPLGNAAVTDRRAWPRRLGRAVLRVLVCVPQVGEHRRDRPRFDAAFDGFPASLVGLGIPAPLVGPAILWFTARGASPRPIPVWAHWVGAVAAGISSIGLIGAVWLGVEPLGILATPVLLVCPWLTWTGPGLAWRARRPAASVPGAATAQ